MTTEKNITAQAMRQDVLNRLDASRKAILELSDAAQIWTHVMKNVRALLLGLLRRLIVKRHLVSPLLAHLGLEKMLSIPIAC